MDRVLLTDSIDEALISATVADWATDIPSPSTAGLNVVEASCLTGVAVPVTPPAPEVSWPLTCLDLSLIS